MQNQQQPGENPLAETQPDPGPATKALPERPVAQTSKPAALPQKGGDPAFPEKSEGHKPFAEVVPYPEPIGG